MASHVQCVSCATMHPGDLGLCEVIGQWANPVSLKTSESNAQAAQCSTSIDRGLWFCGQLSLNEAHSKLKFDHSTVFF